MQILIKLHIFSLVSSDEKNYKCLIGYKDDDNEIKDFLKLTYVKSYDGETIWLQFFIEDDELLET